jgi:hypothetical protein
MRYLPQVAARVGGGDREAAPDQDGGAGLHPRRARPPRGGCAALHVSLSVAFFYGSPFCMGVFVWARGARNRPFRRVSGPGQSSKALAAPPEALQPLGPTPEGAANAPAPER